MTQNNWPATAKQRAYGMALEDQLDEPESSWHSMTVTEASRRIDELVTLKQFSRSLMPSRKPQKPRKPPIYPSLVSA